MVGLVQYLGKSRVLVFGSGAGEGVCVFEAWLTNTARKLLFPFFFCEVEEVLITVMVCLLHPSGSRDWLRSFSHIL